MSINCDWSNDKIGDNFNYTNSCRYEDEGLGRFFFNTLGQMLPPPATQLHVSDLGHLKSINHNDRIML